MFICNNCISKRDPLQMPFDLYPRSLGPCEICEETAECIDYLGKLPKFKQENNTKLLKTKTMLTFGQAVDALKKGKCVSRKGWNGKDMFIFMRPADTISVEQIVNKIKSIPESVKTHYRAQHAWTQTEKKAGKSPEDTFVTFTPYLCMKAADGTIVNGWLASQTDILSEDWIIVE